MCVINICSLSKTSEFTVVSAEDSSSGAAWQFLFTTSSFNLSQTWPSVGGGWGWLQIKWSLSCSRDWSVQERRDAALSRGPRGPLPEECFRVADLWERPWREWKFPALLLPCYNGNEGALLFHAELPAPSATGAAQETLPPIPIQEHKTREARYWVLCENQAQSFPEYSFNSSKWNN